MALSKSSVLVLATTAGAAASTKAAPGATGGWIDCRAFYGGELGYSITNGASAPGVAGTLLFQVSPDNGATVFDYQIAGGDTAASSVSTGSIILDRGVMYVRAIGYGNTTNAVTYAANLQAVTGL
ncbi:MAG: hypothetical protein M3Y65_20560 [Pseudomonadota bacterium]|nr:hypothetical protein [Pseudomonadota bacterium]